jgi:hypothetical protein
MCFNSNFFFDYSDYRNTITDKVKRSINYIFHQKSFYPLMPPHDNTPVDLGLADEYAKLTTLPNMMILPSSLKCFLRVRKKNLSIVFAKVGLDKQ